MGEEWKQNLPAFVERNYPEHKPNYLALKSFFENHKVEEFSLRDFDITDRLFYSAQRNSKKRHW